VAFLKTGIDHTLYLKGLIKYKEKMRELNISLLLLLSTLLISSCIRIVVKGAQSNYHILAPDQLIKIEGENFCEMKFPKNPSVVLINGLQLKSCIKKCNKALVYIWSLHCKGAFCYSPSFLQNYCNENEIEFFLVIEYCDKLFLENRFGLKKPIFGVDTTYYKTDKVSKYLPKFLFDLTGLKRNENRLKYFENGVFVKSLVDINDL
jgi:hypothetical protein